MRFARVYGGEPETLMGLSGLGDLVPTCGSVHSRNFAVGERLGRGVPVADAAGGKLAEGAFTAAVLVDLARREGGRHAYRRGSRRGDRRPEHHG